ncbi:protein kinase family protein [Neobacillus dielmonensis]|uniref:serine/threonine protein kinase n=1 Tax=Neobacillus dielmonensis TaxID=1347369 RepID=UPI000AD4345D|nr:serine/threonine protein kinase [Neobacillus dielmonensis]
MTNQDGIVSDMERYHFTRSLEGVQMKQFINLIEQELLPHIHLSAERPFEPINVRNQTKLWKTVGTGNYAGVFAHPSFPRYVVKVYARNPEQINKEIAVYQRLGVHRAYSFLYAYGEHYLVLKNIPGITLFDAIVQGQPIPRTVIEDVDNGLDYAKSVGLNPYDVHGKNVVMNNGRGYIVDVSDFYKQGYDRKWDDLKKALEKIYFPFIYKYHPPIPFFIVDGIRKGYRWFRKLASR